MSLFLILVIVFVVVWLLVVLPSRRRRDQHAAMQDAVEVGDEIITAGGLHGKIVEEQEETVRIEIAPGVVAKLDRRAIAAVATEVEVEPEDGLEREPGDDAELQRDSAPAPEKRPEPG